MGRNYAKIGIVSVSEIVAENNRLEIRMSPEGLAVAKRERRRAI
jgi:hypothetical protein